MVQQKRMSEGECLHSHSVAFPPMSLIEWTSKDVCSAPMTVWQFVCSHLPWVNARQFLTNLFGKHQISWRMFVRHSFDISACVLSKENHLIYPMCKKLACDALQKGSKIHCWITFFWLVENYFHFSYPKCGKVVTESEIGKFGEEDEKCCFWKCN